MISVSIENNFEGWRAAARDLLQAGVLPDAIVWNESGQNNLFGDDQIVSEKRQTFHVPQKFVELLRMAVCFDSNDRWSLFYRVLFRLVHENKHLLEIESDPDVRQVMLMRKAVARDIHKTHAFVRFREIECDGKQVFVAWHEPHHFTVELSTAFFARRFGSMRWSILTPKGCAHWDLKNLTLSAAATKDMTPGDDLSEEMWLTYYRSIFNPFRLKVKMMKKEMPVRHWRTMPEAQLIPELIRQAK
jgi:probable DNA metabolism protein